MDDGSMLTISHEIFSWQKKYSAGDAGFSPVNVKYESRWKIRSKFFAPWVELWPQIIYDRRVKALPGAKLHWWNRIKVRVLIFGAVMSIIPVVLVSSYYLYYAKRDLQQSIQANNTLFVTNIAAKTDAYLQQIEDRLNDALFAFPVSLPKDAVEIQLYHLLKEIPFADQIVVLDTRGQVRQAVDRFQVIDDPGQLNWFDPNLLTALKNKKTYS